MWINDETGKIESAMPQPGDRPMTEDEIFTFNLINEKREQVAKVEDEVVVLRERIRDLEERGDDKTAEVILLKEERAVKLKELQGLKNELDILNGVSEATL